jgi:hypothetical protein
VGHDASNRFQGLNRIAWLLAGALLAALGVVWWQERSRPRETPRWDRALFAVVHEAAEPLPPPPTWAIAVNPGCPRCRESLAGAAATRAALGVPVRLAVLLVDAPQRPKAAAAAAIGADAVWWDSAGVWRRSWDHRVYGELLAFAPDGSHLRTLPPLAPAGLEPAAVPADILPATSDPTPARTP